MSRDELIARREYLLLASYCGNDNPRCSERRPCDDCLRMCNVFDSDLNYLRELGDASLRAKAGDTHHV